MTDLRGPDLPDATVAADIDEYSVTDAVLAVMADAPNPRLAHCLGVIVSHLHQALREVEPTMQEWEAAVDWLTRAGQHCDDTRQEVVLVSDVLGVSTLVETLNHRRTTGATEATVLGPFHMVESPSRRSGDLIDLVGGGEPCVVDVQVLDTEGHSVPGATVDVWQADENGFYDVQVPDRQPAGNGRGLFLTGSDGRFSFGTVVPSFYPIPTDGPVGELLSATGREPYRPAHIHFIVTATGYVPVVTHIFVAGSAYLDTDAVFAVKRSLVREFVVVDDPDTAADHGVGNPFRHARIDLVVQAEPS